jgi:hypothetical protein
MKATFRGVFLTSEQPEKTAGFYRDVGGLTLETVGEGGPYVYWRIDADGMQIAIHDANAFVDYSHPAFAGSNLTHLYFRIADLQAFLAQLDVLGLQPYAIDDVVVTVIDPDGRKVLFGTA